MKFPSSISLIVLASLAVSGFAASISTIKADISAISSHVNALDKSIRELPSRGATLGQAFAIKSNVEGLSAALNKGAKDIKSTSHFSKGDGKAIFNSFKGSAPTFVQASSNLIAKRAAIKALPVPGIMHLVQGGMKTLHSSLDAFVNALKASEPNDLKGQVNHVKATIDAAFAKAIAAYA